MAKRNVITKSAFEALHCFNQERKAAYMLLVSACFHNKKHEQVFRKKKKRDMNKCNHACHVAYMLSLEVQNTVIRVKPVLKKILETSMHHLLQVKGHL